ncbi:MAG TPA: hypothetical protein VI006_10145 [Solirubrobacteraceae bacterium]
MPRCSETPAGLAPRRRASSWVVAGGATAAFAFAAAAAVAGAALAAVSALRPR